MDTPIEKDPSQEPIASPATTDNNEGMGKSRLRRKLEQRSKKTVLLTILGTIGIIAVLIMYGPSLLIQMSLLSSKVKSEDKNTQQEEQIYIAPPILDPQPSATNSATIIVTGQTTTGDEVKLYNNNEIVDVAKIKKDGSFAFEDVTLQEGRNTLKAAAFEKNEKSNYSNVLYIDYKKTSPNVDIESPHDGDSLSGNANPLTVRGKTDPDVTITINDFLAITKNDGSFSYTLPLQNSENKIKIVATDKAGNKTEKEIKVTYSP
jgi:hypothetical protein